MLKIANLQYFPLAPFARFYRVTDEALIAETAVWPNFLLMNIVFALKGSKLFIIICMMNPPFWVSTEQILRKLAIVLTFYI